MNSRLVKWLVLASVVLMAFPVVAVASTSRIEGMGIQGDYIKDYTNMYSYLSTLCCVGNLVYGELGNTQVLTDSDLNDRAVGAVMNNKWGAWGIHMREITAQLGQGDLTSSTGAGFGGSDPNFNASQAFDLMWAKKFSSMSLGLKLNRSYARAEFDPANDGVSEIKFDWLSAGDPNFYRNIMGYGAGLGFEMGPKTELQLSGIYEVRTYEVKFDDGTSLKEDAPAAFQIAARAPYQWSSNVLIVPVFKYYSFDLSTKDATVDPAVTETNTNTGWQLGLAGNWTLGGNDLFVLGATVAQNQWKREAGDAKLTEKLMPEVFAALETHVNPWLTLRFGARKGVFYSVKQENNTPSEFKYEYSPFTMEMGAGIKLSTLQIDATLNQDFVHNMPYLVSGSSTNPLFPKVSATYSW